MPSLVLSEKRGGWFSEAAGPTREMLEQRQKELVDQDLWKGLGTIGTLGLGAGLGLRGLQGLYNVVRRNIAPPKSPRPAVMIEVPDPTAEDQDQEKQSSIDPTQVTNAAYHPLALPGAVAVGAGSLYGGWKLMDYLLDQRNKAEMATELERSKKEYEGALHAQFDKHASALGQDLDHLFELQQEKRAEHESLNDYLGLGSGLALTAMGGLGVGSALVAYNMTKKRQEAELVRKAQKRQAMREALTHPPEIFAMPAASRSPEITKLESQLQEG